MLDIRRVSYEESKENAMDRYSGVGTGHKTRSDKIIYPPKAKP